MVTHPRWHHLRRISVPGLLALLAACATDTVQPVKGSMAEHRGSLIVAAHPLKDEVQEVLEQLLRAAGQPPRFATLYIVRGGEGIGVSNCALREINVSEGLLNMARDKMQPAARRMMFANLLGHELGHILKGNCGHHPDTELEADRLAIEWSRKAGYGCSWLRDRRKALADKQPDASGRFLTTWALHPDLNARAYEQVIALCPPAPGKLAAEEPSSPVTISCPKGSVWTGKGCIAEEVAKSGPPAASRPGLLSSPPTRQPGTTALTSATVPTWENGYEWKFHWSSPSGSGTLVRTIVGEEIIGGIPHYVMRSGTREILYTKTDLAWGMERVKGAVEARASPAYRGFAWPLEPGKEWEARYRWESLSGRRTEDRVRRHKVEAQEAVSVPAGRFQALHVIVKDQGGGWEYEYWYAPEVKWIVKDRTYLSSGVRERELVEYRVSPAATPTTSRPAR